MKKTKQYLIEAVEAFIAEYKKGNIDANDHIEFTAEELRLIFENEESINKKEMNWYERH